MIDSVDSCLKDGWWLEAVKFAEKVEKKTLDFDVLSWIKICTEAILFANVNMLEIVCK